MNKTTFSIDVYGDLYEEIIIKAEEEINDLLGIEDKMPIDDLASYEIFITKDEDLQADFNYKANIVARIKHYDAN